MTGLLEMSLVFGSVLALAIFELLALRRARRRDKKNRGADVRDEPPR